MNLNSLKILVILPFLSTLVACGGSTNTVEIRDYKMAVLDDDPEVKWEFEKMINEFNSYAGLEAIQYVDSPNNANSVVFLTKGLKDNSPLKNKIGYGQWLAEIQENQWYASPGQERQRIVKYAMRIELDEDYVRERIEDETTVAKKEKQVLFFHEIGHGLEMDHNPDENDIMYRNVSSSRGFAPFFHRVRAYLTN